MDPLLKLQTSNEDLLTDPSVYRRLVGRLLYLTISRPYITFVVNKLSQLVSKPSKAHLSAVYHLLRYLKVAPGQGIFLASTSSFQLKAFADSDWGPVLKQERVQQGFAYF